MNCKFWIRRIFSKVFSDTSRPKAKQTSHKLSLLPLEDRLVPAVPFAPAFPHALSINAPGSTVTNSASFSVTFNQPVVGVDAADFQLVTTGTVAGGTISSVTGSGASYTVSVTGITGTGTLGVNLVDLPTITALPSFATQQTFATGNGPRSVTLGDVNGDGKLDLITANINSNNASVLLGNGNGTFQNEQTFATGTNPLSITLGDVNGDGKLDLITANFSSNNASVLLGNGNGTFQAEQTFATGTNPVSVTLGDVNGDGRLDIVTANRNSNNASVLLGNGNGTFQNEQTFATGTNPFSVTLGDVNGDGRLDIVTANINSNNASVLLGNGNGTFQGEQTFATGTGSFPYSVTLGDVNGDGRLDIVTANRNSNTTSVLLGNGNGTFQGEQTFATGTGSFPYSVTLGDVNGDGRLDIVTANTISNTASVLLGTGGSAITATFSPQQTFAAGTNPTSVTLGDVNGDGRLDIVTANRSSNNASVLLGNGNGTFQAEQTFATGTSPNSGILGDVNGDGRLDIVTANINSNNASVLLGNGNGTFQNEQTFATGTNPISVTLGDVNGDGRLDIITANYSDNTASVLLGNGNGTFQGQQTFATGTVPNSVTLGDVNGDGRLDIVTANFGNNTASVLLGNGNGTFQGQQTFATGASPISVTLGDVNGDGKLDIVTANFSSKNASVLLGNGNGTFQGQQTFATGTNPISVTLGDVNGDGKLDIVTANFGNKNASVLLGNGNGTFQGQQTFATGTNPYSVTLGDVNGDGRLDIVTANFISNNASVLLNSLAFTGNTVTVQNATKAVLITQAAGSASGSAFTTQPLIAIQDAFGNTVTNSTAAVTMTVSGGDGNATTVGTVTVNAVNGVATFSGVGISGTAGTQYTLTFASTGLTSATQNITPTFGTATRLQVTLPAANGYNNLPFATQPVVNILDAFGNTVTSSTAVVTISSDNGSTIVGPNTATAVNGVATFSGTGLKGLPLTSYTLTYSSPSLTSITQSFTLTPAPAPLVTGSAPPTGNDPNNPGNSVSLYDAQTGQPNGVAVPFPNFMGQIRIAAGDFNQDGRAEIVAAAGPGGGPAVTILDSQTGAPRAAFFAYDPAFTGGVFVAVKDINNDGVADIITGAGFGGGPHVKVFDGVNLQEIRSFFAYAEAFTGGVSVGSADINGDNILDIVTGAGPGGGPHVKVFDGATNTLLSSWFAYPVNFTGGVFVAAGDISNDGNIEVVTGAGIGGGPVVAVWNPFTGQLLSQFFAYNQAFTGGVRVGVSDATGDGILDMVTGAGPGGGPQVNAYNFPNLDLLFSFFSGPESNRQGVFVS